MKHREHGSADTVFALSLLSLFAVLALFVALIGSSVYRTTVERSAKNDRLRTSVAYVAGKVRAAGKEAELRTVEGTEVLVLREHGDQTDYLTYIYSYNGSLCEFYCAEGDAFSPLEGEPLSESTEVAFAEQNGILTVTAQIPDGNPVELYLRLKNDD